MTTTNDQNVYRLVLAASADPIRRGRVQRRVVAAPRADADDRSLRRITRARLRVEASTGSRRSGRLSTGQCAVPRLHVGVSRGVSGPRRAARRAAAPRARAMSAQRGARRRLSARVLVRPSGRAERVRRVRRRRPRRADLLLLVDAARSDAHGAGPRRLPAGGRIHVPGHVSDEAIGEYLAAADVCLCLRWPTALETSASWLHCLAARKATVISDLAHLVDIPASVALRVDLVDEDESLFAAMQQLVERSALRDELAAAGHAYWRAHHTLA